MMVKEGRFREDLFYRLNVFPIRLPPLRSGQRTFPFSPGHSSGSSAEPWAGRSIPFPVRPWKPSVTYSWPGNIRELRNVIKRAMIVTQGPTLEVEMPSLSGGTSLHAGHFSRFLCKRPDGMTLDDTQRCQILAILEKTGWRVSGKNGAAAILGLKPTTLESRMAKLGIKRTR